MVKDEQLEKTRVDRWLWTSRLYKTRNMASAACSKNWVKLAGVPIKPSKTVRIGDILTLRMGPLEKVVQIVGISQRRVSASLTQNLLNDLTSPEAYQKATELKLHISPRSISIKGTGRPTKKQRRDLEDFLYPE